MPCVLCVIQMMKINTNGIYVRVWVAPCCFKVLDITGHGVSLPVRSGSAAYACSVQWAFGFYCVPFVCLLYVCVDASDNEFFGYLFCFLRFVW